MITVHHLENSRSQRILWLLEELGLEYRVERYARDPVTMQAPATLKAIHPLGKSPLLSDGATTVAESGAIIEYLLDAHGAGHLRPPAGSPARLRFNYWLHYAEGSAMTPLLLALVFRRVARAPMPFFVRPVARAIADGAMKSYIQPQIDLHLDYMEAELARSTWFAGADFSAADIQMSFPVEAGVAQGGRATQRPRLRAFLARIAERPAHARALAAGGPYEMPR